MAKISLARLHKLDTTGPTKAFADINIADAILIQGVRIVEGSKGLFVAMPKEEGRDGNWYSVITFLNKATQDEINRVVLEAYKQ